MQKASWHKKTFHLALFFFCCGLLHLNAASDIMVKAEPEARLVRQGEKVRLQVDFSFPEDRVLGGWMLGAYLPYLPKAFPEAAGIKVSVHKDPRWSSVCISGWHWLQGEQRQPGRKILEFDTASWSPGDYKLELRGLFRRREQSSVESDLYHSGHFLLTIVEP
ncbi:MAG: hypothetical protein WCT05_06535 [Lentisphaeria bacterium]